MRDGTAVVECNYLTVWEFQMGRWHRSRDKKEQESIDFISYMINKKWWLEEQFNVHMMRFQQVKSNCYSNNFSFLILGWFVDK